MLVEKPELPWSTRMATTLNLPTIYRTPSSVRRRLREIGLTQEIVNGTAVAWARAAAAASPFAPKNAPGLLGWVDSVAYTRRALIQMPTEKWEMFDRRGAPFAMNKELGVTLAITSANNITGIDIGNKQPVTKNEKGVVTLQAV